MYPVPAVRTREMESLKKPDPEPELDEVLKVRAEIPRDCKISLGSHVGANLQAIEVVALRNYHVEIRSAVFTVRRTFICKVKL